MHEIGTRQLGRQGLRVSSLGLGCMGMSELHGPCDERESIATIQRAIDLGVSFLDTADMYTPSRPCREVAPRGAAAGERYPEAAMHSIDR